jgi:hypothetical protein
MTANDTVGATASKDYTVVINRALKISTGSLPTGHLRKSYNQTVKCTGGTGALTWSVSSGNLPTGLTLNRRTGQISGTPTVARAFTFTITATDSLGATVIKSYTVAIKPLKSLAWW